MSMCVCAISLYLFIIEFSYDMKEVEALEKLFESIKEETSNQSFIEQNRQFEQFLFDMKINVEKKKILISREDTLPQTVCFNS